MPTGIREQFPEPGVLNWSGAFLRSTAGPATRRSLACLATLEATEPRQHQDEGTTYRGAVSRDPPGRSQRGLSLPPLPPRLFPRPTRPAIRTAATAAVAPRQRRSDRPPSIRHARPRYQTVAAGPTSPNLLVTRTRVAEPARNSAKSHRPYNSLRRRPRANPGPGCKNDDDVHIHTPRRGRLGTSIRNARERRPYHVSASSWYWSSMARNSAISCGEGTSRLTKLTPPSRTRSTISSSTTRETATAVPPWVRTTTASLGVTLLDQPVQHRLDGAIVSRGPRPNPAAVRSPCHGHDSTRPHDGPFAQAGDGFACQLPQRVAYSRASGDGKKGRALRHRRLD